MDRLLIGADIAKDTFEVAVCGPNGEVISGRFCNTPAGFAELADRLEAARASWDVATAPVLLVVEPTGGYELALAAFGHQAGWLVSRPNPKRVRDWAKSQGRRAKTDRLDAHVLARYGASQTPACWRPLPVELSELASLLGRQDELQQMLQAERNRQAAVARQPASARLVGQNLAAMIATLESGLAEIEQAIQAHIRAQPRLQAKLRQLRTVPGIGAKNGPYILLLLGRWEHLTDGQGQAKGLVAYTGLDPQTYESGTSVHRHASISRMGQSQTRRLLYMGALGGVRGHNPLREFYQRLVGRGKAKKLALTAGARKILVWAWAVYRHDTPFDPNRSRSKAAVTA
jgi:transposase